MEASSKSFLSARFLWSGVMFHRSLCLHFNGSGETRFQGTSKARPGWNVKVSPLKAAINPWC
jgi:hypothetical protein